MALLLNRDHILPNDIQRQGTIQTRFAGTMPATVKDLVCRQETENQQTAAAAAALSAPETEKGYSSRLAVQQGPIDSEVFVETRGVYASSPLYLPKHRAGEEDPEMFVPPSTQGAAVANAAQRPMQLSSWEPVNRYENAKNILSGGLEQNSYQSEQERLKAWLAQQASTDTGYAVLNRSGCENTTTTTTTTLQVDANGKKHRVHHRVKGSRLAKRPPLPFSLDDFANFRTYFLAVTSQSVYLDTLGYLFSDPVNAFHVHKLLTEYIWDQLNVNLPLQRLEEMAIMMANAWLAYIPYRLGKGHEFEDVKKLNDIVLNAMVPQVSATLIQQARYVATIDHVPLPQPYPINDNNGDDADTKHNYDLTWRLDVGNFFRQRDEALWNKFSPVKPVYPPPSQPCTSANKCPLYPTNGATTTLAQPTIFTNGIASHPSFY
jgi:hypothetical protein